MSHHHDCSDVISKVFLALDGELSPDEEKDFLTEINKCSSCLGKYSIEHSFKQFLTEKIERRKVDPSLIQAIREKLNIEAIS